MPVTRAQAYRALQEELDILRKIEMDYVPEYTYKITGVSATGVGVHTRWIYSKEPLSQAGAIPQNDPSLDIQRTEPESAQGQEPRPQDSVSEYASLEDRKSGAPESPLATTPQPFEHASQPSRVTADTDMKFLVHIKKDEDVEEAVRRHIELYTKESEIRKRENQRRIYQFIKTRPQLLDNV